jgi:hypothetical protein
MSTKWRIYCEEPGDLGWHEEWSDTAITTCPNNVAHPVNANSVQELEVSVNLFRIPIYTSTNNTTFTRAVKFQYSPSRSGIIRGVKCNIYKTGNMTTFSIMIYDSVSRLELLNTTLSETGEYVTTDLGSLSNVPIADTLLEVYLKRTGGTSTSKIFIEDMIFYS